VVDKAVIAQKIAAIRDAVTRVREVVPQSADAFRADRTTREVVTLNLFVALQETIAIATHWLADEGWDVPQSYGEAFIVLADRKVLERGLALRLAASAGLRNLIAHQYGALNVERIFAIASHNLDDLLSFCEQIAGRMEEG
jgi:uncharacterized protein YutE (UPF0331/DUF86 family)